MVTIITDWETICQCGEVDEVIGQSVWCFLHQGPHPLDNRDEIDEIWEQLYSEMTKG